MPEIVDRLKTALSVSYRLERELGVGGMATVYLAQDLKHGRPVAVKVLRPELAAALGRERFLQEIQIAANLHHPHILPLFDSGEADGFLYYVMPFEEGRSLREKLEKEGELPIREAVRILRDVVDALAHAHGQDVTHRDIKPDNVMLTARHALVTDFGVAKAVSEATGKEQLTEAGVALGTPAYMAPEQAAADPHVDHRADIYAVGALAYEMLAGRPPFLGATAQMVLSAHIVEKPDPVTRYREAVPTALEALILKCLEKRPADRWQSAEELLPHLEAFATPDGGITPTATPPISRKRGRRIAPLIATAIVAVLAVVAVFKWIPGRAGPEQDPSRIVVLPFQNRTGDPSLDQLGAMAADWLTEGMMDLATVVDPVPTLQVTQLLQEGAGGSVPPEERVGEFAEAAGAGTVVSGSYYRFGDSLEFQAQVIDVCAGTVLGAAEPARGPVHDPGFAIGLLRQQITSIVGARFDPLMQVEIPGSTRPPSYEAYQAYDAGMRAYMNGAWTDALRNLERASELDPSYMRTSVITVAVYRNLGQPAVAESLAVEALESPQGLNQYDRLRMEGHLAQLHGDRVAAFRAGRTAAELSPGGTTHYAAIGGAVAVNRPVEALEISERLSVPRGLGRAIYWHYGNLASVHHLLGEHERELSAAERGREAWPGYLPNISYEVRALAALGQIGPLEERINECLTLSPHRGWTPGDVIRTATRELASHGYPEAAQNVLRRAYEWHERQSAEEARTEARRFDLAQTLYLDGELGEAEALFEGLTQEFPDNPSYLGYLGAIAARLEDGEAAREIGDRLRRMDRPYILGRHTLWRARIASLLAEKESAVSLLREALSQGREYGPELLADLDFQPLWDFPPYQELMRPKG